MPLPLQDEFSNLPRMKIDIKAFNYVLYRQIEDFLKVGWIAIPPNSTDHHHHYGIEVMWICECEIRLPAREKK